MSKSNGDASTVSSDMPPENVHIVFRLRAGMFEILVDSAQKYVPLVDIAEGAGKPLCGWMKEIPDIKIIHADPQIESIKTLAEAMMLCT